MGQEAVSAEHHRAALLASVGVLLDHLLSEFTGMVGHKSGMSSDEAEYPDISSLPLMPLACQVDRLSLTANLGFAQRYPMLHLLDIASGISQ